MKQVTVRIIDSDGQEVGESFDEDELTSPVELAILWLKEQEGDPLDG